ncbi:uncharacterized protein TNCV_4483521 [Trichonephila clavipes]|nr:uncharacterized protein TNCV_4483521 [Trichonephila clavipes]
MRCIGKGKSSAKVLIGVMNLPTLSQRFNENESGLETAIETVATRGHRSLNGAAIATRVDTSKVLDASILSRFCKFPNKIHSENYKANHFVNSGSMEVSGAIEIFQRTESLHDLRYTKFLGDGDSKAYKAVNEMQPYEDTSIKKLECVGHVKKRMGTRLRALKLKMKGKKLSDNKTLGGSGRLTDADIDKL